MKIAFIGESWQGSCARSMREALARRSGVELFELDEDAWFTNPKALWLRIVKRITEPAYIQEFNERVLRLIQDSSPDVLMTYKGNFVRKKLLEEVRKLGVPTVNIYPDCSPHAYGEAHKEAVGLYDLVVSTKQFHPQFWNEVYGYSNRCVFVPQGYDPRLHLVETPPLLPKYDVAMIATYRSEYGRLMSDFASAASDLDIRVAIGGNGWGTARPQLPRHWELLGPVQGRGYVSLIRNAKICIAPLSREVLVNGKPQLGDVDSTRTYELAAAYCFFLHRRTDLVQELYSAKEVPTFDTAAELAEKVRYFLENDEARLDFAAAAHSRAVPAYSVDLRAEEILRLVNVEFG
jgi:glycosyltransferase involved in cell wall biosynthesis